MQQSGLVAEKLTSSNLNVKNPKTNNKGNRNEDKTDIHSNLSRVYGEQRSCLSAGSGDADGAAWRAAAEWVETIFSELCRPGHLPARVRSGGLVDAGYDQVWHAPRLT
jgi:hypothetical protein